MVELFLLFILMSIWDECVVGAIIIYYILLSYSGVDSCINVSKDLLKSIGIKIAIIPKNMLTYHNF